MTGFQIQERSSLHNVWVVPAEPFSQQPQLVRSQSVDELRESIRKAADSRTLSFPQHVRIVTDRGEPIERWVIRSGSAKKLRRRF